MASKRQIDVGGVKIGGGAPVAVQSMTKTETADFDATMRQIHAIADAGGDLVRCAVPRDEDVEALERIVGESPIPVIADIHFNHTLALKAIDAGAHCIRINPGNIGGHEKTGEVVDKARAAGVADADRRQLRLAAQAPARARAREPGGGARRGRRRVRRADGAARLRGLQGLDQVHERAQHDRARTGCCPSGSTTRSTSASPRRAPSGPGSLKSAVGLGTLLADGVGDTIRISLSTFHAEEEVKVAWEILKALKLRERGPVLIACPTCGRLQFDMDTVVAEIEERLEAYDDPIEVAVLGCAVNGIGEASHADFGITGAKNEGLIFAHGKPLRKVPQERLVDALFAEIDKSIDRGARGRGRAQGRRGRGVAREDRGGERRRADARADRRDGGRGGRRRGARRTAPSCRWRARRTASAKVLDEDARPPRAAASHGPRRAAGSRSHCLERRGLRAQHALNASTTAGRTACPRSGAAPPSASSADRRPVGAVGDHGVEGVAHRHHPGAQRDLLAGQPVRVAGAVPALVARAHERGHGPQAGAAMRIRSPMMVWRRMKPHSSRRAGRAC